MRSRPLGDRSSRYTHYLACDRYALKPTGFQRDCKGKRKRRGLRMRQSLCRRTRKLKEGSRLLHITIYVKTSRLPERSADAMRISALSEGNSSRTSAEHTQTNAVLLLSQTTAPLTALWSVRPSIRLLQTARRLLQAARQLTYVELLGTCKLPSSLQLPSISNSALIDVLLGV